MLEEIRYKEHVLVISLSNFGSVKLYDEDVIAADL